MQIGRIVGREIKKNRDGIKTSLLLQVEISSPKDIQTVELISQDGEDTNPVDNSRVVIIPIGQAYKIAIAVNDGIAPDPTQVPGEKKIYSSDGGAIKAFIQWLKTGAMILSGTLLQMLGSTKIEITAPVIEINGNADFAVSFNDLAIAFIAFQTEFDAHIHSGILAGPGTTGTPTVPSVADITPAKVSTVKLP